MEKILIFIKHHFRIIWKIIEWVNGTIFKLLYRSNLEKVLPEIFKEFSLTGYSFRRLKTSDSEKLFVLIKSQDDSDLLYFSPHSFDLISIRKQSKNISLLMMGVFEGEKLVGYFFLRFFANRKCFVGRLIDKDYRGKGIGTVMNSIMYETGWRMGFRCLSTISRNNAAVMRAHAKNPSIVVLKELQNDYILVEFVRENKSTGFPSGAYEKARSKTQ